MDGLLKKSLNGFFNPVKWVKTHHILKYMIDVEGGRGNSISFTEIKTIPKSLCNNKCLQMHRCPSSLSDSEWVFCVFFCFLLRWKLLSTIHHQTLHSSTTYWRIWDWKSLQIEGTKRLIEQIKRFYCQKACGDWQQCCGITMYCTKHSYHMINLTSPNVVLKGVHVHSYTHIHIKGGHAHTHTL